jgi:hypothetical protein
MSSTKNLNEISICITSVDELKRIGTMFVQSGFFQDTREAAQACVKIMAGSEMGIPPFASMTGINIIQGKPAIGANIMAAKIKSSGKYNYVIKEHDNDGCTLEFFEDDKSIGLSSFTKKDAEMASLLNKGPWKSFPRNMYFARALSNGCRWHCPDVFWGAPVYTPEELGAHVDEEGNMIDIPMLNEGDKE